MNTIDKIFVISFYNNQNRINNILRMQEKFDKKFIIVEPIKDDCPERSLFKTYLKIWLENLDKNILIFEDDFFTRYSKDEIEFNLNCFYEQVDDFDLLLLGGDVYRGEYINSNLIKVEKFTETHAILYNKKFLLKLFSTIASYISGGSKNFHVDQILSNLISIENVKCYAISPFLFTQQNFPSLINNVNQINFKYDIDHLFKREFDNNSIKITNHEFNDDFFSINYRLTNEKDNNCKVNIFVLDINSGIRVLTHEMVLFYELEHFSKSGRLLCLKDEVFFEIYNKNKIMIRKKIKKTIK